MTPAGARTLATILLALVAFVAGGCGGGGDSKPKAQLDVVGYSTPEAAYEEYLEPDFQGIKQGHGVEFGNSFGQSQEQRRAVEGGQPASIVQLANGSEMEELVRAGVVAKGWDQKPFHGIAQRSLIVIMVRKGNPLDIRSFADLQKKSVRVIVPDPISSDAGTWGVVGIYGSELREGRSKVQALAATERLLEKAKQPANGKEAMEAFRQGHGDALVSYENEAIEAEREDKGLHYILPHSTVYVESPIAVTKGAPKAARQFLHYMWSTAGQELWTENELRAATTYVLNPTQFPLPDNLFKVAGLGGWAKIDRELFDPKMGAIAEFERELGVARGG